MIIQGLFPDVEQILCDAFADLGHTGTRTDTNLQSMLPFIVVVRRGGGADLVNDRPRLDIDTYAATHAQARQIAVTIRQRLVPGPVHFTGAVLDRVLNTTGPVELPYADSNVRRFTASYVATVRRWG